MLQALRITPFSKAVREYPPTTFLTVEEMQALPDYEWKNYMREKLWDKIAEEGGLVFDDCEPLVQSDIDFEALLRLVKAVEQTREEALPGGGSNA